MKGRIKKQNLKERPDWIYTDEKTACKTILRAKEFGMTPSEYLSISIELMNKALEGNLSEYTSMKEHMEKELKKMRDETK